MNNGILVATQSGTVNLNVDQKTLDMCIKSTSNWGHTLYTNICNGESYVIQAGSFDWTITIVFLVLGVGIGLSLIAMFLKMTFSY